MKDPEPLHEFNSHLKFCPPRIPNTVRLKITQKLCYVAIAVCASGVSFKVAAASISDILFEDNFNYTNGLIVNEFTYWNPGDPAAHTSPVWELTSGSLFAVGGAGWTGVPDDVNPNANSSNGNDSAVFRLTTIKSNFADVAVSFTLL